MWKQFLIISCVFFSQNLSAETKVLAFAGSTRAGSFNKQLIADASEIARELGASVTFIDLKDYPMPFYDADLEAEQGMPSNAKRFRNLLIEHQVVLIASPQYNASIPAVLKNALDWASRSEQATGSKEAFKGKKFAIMSASPGAKGGARGLIHLRTILEDVGATVLQAQVSVPNANNAFDADGKLKDAKLQEDLFGLVSEALKN